MASTSGRNTPATRPTQKHSRAQCLLHNITRLHILVYVDDLMFLGVDSVDSTINKIFGAIQQHLMLRSTDTLTPGNTVAFLGRNITNIRDHYEISLADSYTTKLLEETSLSNCKPATTPGTSALKTATAEQEQKLNHEEHSAFRRAVGKLQWMTYTRPDISYATKELARSLRANNSRPTETQTPSEIHQRN